VSSEYIKKNDNFCGQICKNTHFFTFNTNSFLSENQDFTFSYGIFLLKQGCPFLKKFRVNFLNSDTEAGLEYIEIHGTFVVVEIH
jgi:hypothetical protein